MFRCRRAKGVVLALLFSHELQLLCSAALTPSMLPTTSTPTTQLSSPNVLPGVLVDSPSRRQLLAASSAYATIASLSSFTLRPVIASGPFTNNDENNQRRQVELCLVAIQRVAYWADRQATALLSSVDGISSEQQRKELYLESRLGAKAILTSKVLGSAGSTIVVYTLSTLNIPACLADLEWHASRELPKASAYAVEDAKQRFTEGLASIVEFDGLETLTDPSPRSTLTLAQYNDAKALFVIRAFRELVLPASRQLLQSFGPDPLERTLRYIEQYYSSEIPTPANVPPTDTTI